MAEAKLSEKEYELANKILSMRGDVESKIVAAESCGLDCQERRDRVDFCKQLADKVKAIYFPGRP